MSFNNKPNDMENYETYKYKLGYCLKNEKYKNHAGFDRYDDMKMFIQNLNQDGLSYVIWNSKGERVEIFPLVDYSKIKPKALCYWCLESHYLEEIITIPEYDVEETFCKTCCETEDFKEFLENNNIANSV
tara:strand:+ start:71 stop:460 length:390 start_codon:yes stop_codon:yes gene_type:complete